ncbi:MAG: hypothetical protein ACYSW3_24550 [Planctomycetota bacterium]|jgi:hypothetical protein
MKIPFQQALDSCYRLKKYNPEDFTKIIGIYEVRTTKKILHKHFLGAQIMGYSIMTTFTKKNKDNMLNFLEKNFREWNQLSGEENTYRGPTDDVSYSGNLKILIGFDYSSWAGQTPAVAYIFRICYWMAAITQQRFVMYDGDEKWWLSELGVDEFGFKNLANYEAHLYEYERKKYNKIIKKELRRLTLKL